MNIDAVSTTPVHGRVLSRVRSAPVMRHYAIGLCAALLAGLIFSYVSLMASAGAGMKQTDFVSYYSAARLTLHGAGHTIYDLQPFGRYERALVYPLTVRNGVLPYVYPPYLSLLMAPFGALPYGASYLVWLGANLMIIGATLYAWQRRLSLGRAGSALLWAASLSYFPVFVALVQGQTSILILGLFAAALFALQSRHDALAGIALAPALIKPQYVAPVLLVLAFHNRKALAYFIAAAAMLYGLPALVFGPHVDLDYLRMLQRAEGWTTQFGYAPRLNQGLWGFTGLLLPTPVSRALDVLLMAGALGGLAVVARISRHLEIVFALAIVTGVALSQHLLIHDLSLALLPALVAVSLAKGPPRRAVLLTAGYVAVLAGLRLIDLVPIQWSFLALAALAGWLASAALQYRTRVPYLSLVPQHRPAEDVL